MDEFMHKIKAKKRGANYFYECDDCDLNFRITRAGIFIENKGRPLAIHEGSPIPDKTLAKMKVVKS